MIDWNHIMDKQPEDGEWIVRCEQFYDNFYIFGMRKYESYGCAFEELIKINQESGLKNPDYWWVYSKDFPFPNKDKAKDD